MDAALARLVWKRANHCCEYCQLSQEYDDRSFEIDHINDPFRVEVREELMEEGLFPPA